MMASRSALILGTKPLSKGWMQSSRCILFAFLFDLDERCGHDLQVSEFDPASNGNSIISESRQKLLAVERETSIAWVKEVSGLAVRV